MDSVKAHHFSASSVAVRQHDKATPGQFDDQPSFNSFPAPAVATGSGAVALQSRDYDIVVGIPDRLIAKSLEWTISSVGQLQRVRSICNVDELIATICSESPRIVLLDEQSAGPNLQSIARQIPVRLGDCMIAMFSDRLSCRQLHMSSAYVNGLLSRQTTIPAFMSELDVVAGGHRIVSEFLQSRVVLDKRRRFEVLSVEKIQKLTNRQLEVLIRIAQGMTAKEAAQDLHLTEKAIESHKYRLMRILGVRDRIELCRWAYARESFPSDRECRSGSRSGHPARGTISGRQPVFSRPFRSAALRP